MVVGNETAIAMKHAAHWAEVDVAKDAFMRRVIHRSKAPKASSARVTRPYVVELRLGTQVAVLLSMS